VASFTDANVAASIVNLVLTAAGVLFGIKGNAWHEAHLLNREFVLVGTVTAEDGKRAIAHFQLVTR
jgi:hypothetical protein